MWGKEIRRLAQYGINGGIGAGTEDGTLPAAAGNNYDQFVLTLKNLYGTIEISDKAVRASENNVGAFVNLLNAEMEGLLKASSFNFGRMLFGDGNGTLGKVYYSEFSLIRRRGVPKWGMFHRKDANGGGALCDLGVHLIDAALWVMGSPKFTAISGMASAEIAHNETNILTSLAESGAPAGVFNARKYSPEEFEVEEFAAGSIRLDNGCCLNFKTSWAVNLPNEYAMSFAGSKAGLLLPKVELLSTMGHYQADIQPRLFPQERRFAKEAFPGHFFLFENAVDHILYGTPLMVKPEETLNVAAIIDAFYISAAENREVRAEEILK